MKWSTTEQVSMLDINIMTISLKKPSDHHTPDDKIKSTTELGVGTCTLVDTGQ